MLRAKANASKALMVELAVTGVFGQKKGMVHPVTAPESCPVGVIFTELWKDWAVIDTLSVIGIQADE